MSSTETVYGQSLSLLPTPFIISLEDTETMCPKGNKGGKGSIMFSDMYTHTLFSTKKKLSRILLHFENDLLHNIDDRVMCIQ